MGIGEKVYILRRAKRLTQEQLAEMLSISRQSVSQWESGQVKDIKKENIEALAKIFGVTTSLLYDDAIKLNEDGTPIYEKTKAAGPYGNYVYDIYCLVRRKLSLFNTALLFLEFFILVGTSSCLTAKAFLNPVPLYLALAPIVWLLSAAMLYLILKTFLSYQKVKIGFMTPDQFHMACFDGKSSWDFDLPFDDILAIEISGRRKDRGRIGIRPKDGGRPYGFSALIYRPMDLRKAFEDFKRMKEEQ